MGEEKYKKVQELSKEIISLLLPFETIYMPIPMDDNKYDYSLTIEIKEKDKIIEELKFGFAESIT